ncbi:CYFA0S01e07800g1_1 [Cyberlindnera fabianii]|uniref:CYFA0S01e07800g1_1 n=1 Tax=Cyberlindnera fabianii TaxID=36022 RepID=A0A061AHU1_CYBFA|nr:CYFA0S01e07800g1_1 [Cyberlindnera fabianii]
MLGKSPILITLLLFSNFCLLISLDGDPIEIVTFQSLNSEPELSNAEPLQDLSGFDAIVDAAQNDTAKSALDLGVAEVDYNHPDIRLVSKDPSDRTRSEVVPHFAANPFIEGEVPSVIEPLRQETSLKVVDSKVQTVQPSEHSVTPDQHTITSTTTSIQVVPFTLAEAPTTTVIVHTVSTLTVTPSETTESLITPPPNSILASAPDTPRPLEMAVSHVAPEFSISPLLVVPSAPSPAPSPLPLPPSAPELLSLLDSISPVEFTTPVTASGKLSDSLSLGEVQKMFHDTLQRFKDEVLGSRPLTSSAIPGLSPEPTEKTISPPAPPRKSGDMDFGTFDGPLADADRLLSEFGTDIDDTTKESVRRVLRSILKNDDHEIELPLSPVEARVVSDSSSAVPSLSSVPVPLQNTQEMLVTKSKDINAAGLRDKDQVKVEKYFSLLNLGRLKGLPEDLVHDILDFIKAKDKHQFVDDFRHRPFRKKVGLDVTSEEPSTSPSAGWINTPLSFLEGEQPHSESDTSKVTDFNDLELQLDLYLAENPIRLEKADPEEGEEDNQLGNFHQEEDVDNLNWTIDENLQDVDDEDLKAHGLLRSGLKKLRKPSEEEGSYALLQDKKYTSRFGKQPRLKKIGLDGEEEEIELYDIEDQLFSDTDRSKSKKGHRGELVSSKNQNTLAKSKKKVIEFLDEDVQLKAYSSSAQNKTSGINDTITSGGSREKVSNTTTNHDEFLDLVKQKKKGGKFRDDDDPQSAPAGLYLEKLKKNPSSLFKHPAEEKHNSKLDHGESKESSSKKDPMSALFNFHSSAPRISLPHVRSYLSYSLIFTALCILAV